MKDTLSQYDSGIKKIPTIYGPNRVGDIAHSLACIDKARTLLGVCPRILCQARFERGDKMVLGKFVIF